ncbi:hypothetical protein Scep_002094 [Stephania cephalantha]|uniref:Uncharacterized protein n=1 Tax=Stephania cephalantha TaxID=152367 RepID=A0AAP0L9E3_9MAGN
MEGSRSPSPPLVHGGASLWKPLQKEPKEGWLFGQHPPRFNSPIGANHRRQCWMPRLKGRGALLPYQHLALSKGPCFV